VCRGVAVWVTSNFISLPFYVAPPLVYASASSLVCKAIPRMSYQVLARKWRPKSFREMVGQVHVLQALINALDQDRLHHAYLFTGTRGVGKTTIARILARCLNCERGVSSQPCGECSSCVEIAEGRSVDLWEIDAASRTKVEDTRELLENVQYAPTRARYKVYLIDEVHMLSGHSFNALLKTLEEPPPHVKFLLATTDPQKLPATVLSRCLQFNLKNMMPEQVVSHLSHVLEQEMVSFEEPALWLLGRAADGSMRDALSLTDQAISYGSGKLTEGEVRSMLGTVDLSFVVQLLESVVAADCSAALATIASMAEHAPDFEGALDGLISLIHRVAVAQAVPEAVDNTWGDGQQVAEFARSITGEDAQFYYQVAINGKRDIGLAGELRSGFEMVLLRMIAFRPAAILDESLTPADLQPAGLPTANPVAGEVDAPLKKSLDAPAASVHSPQPVSEAAPKPAQQAKPEPQARPEPAPVLEPPLESEPTPGPELQPQPPSEPVSAPAAEQAAAETSPGSQPDAIGLHPVELSVGNWAVVLDELGLVGIVYNIASNCELVSCEDGALEFILDQGSANLFNEGHSAKICTALSNYYGKNLSVSVTPGAVTGETPAMIMHRLKAERQRRAVVALEDDPLLQQLIERFDGQLDRSSIVPLEP
jgi:DNA polymerase III subunit gamma/tau